MPEMKELLARYLSAARDALTWKLEGLSDYDVRRPMTSTGTNLLGLVKHAAVVRAGCLGDCMGRPFPDPPACYGPDAEDNHDLWALPHQTRADIEALWAAPAPMPTPPSRPFPSTLKDTYRGGRMSRTR